MKHSVRLDDKFSNRGPLFILFYDAIAVADMSSQRKSKFAQCIYSNNHDEI